MLFKNRLARGKNYFSSMHYLFSSIPKSNSAYAAINKALEKVKGLGDLSIPLHLRNAPNSFMKDLGYGENYQYSHDHKNKLHLQEFLPETISGESFYKPQENPKEKVYKDAINQIWKGEI
ncbi:MAG: hypothetical protein CM15mP65_20060 [Crocinitomicaceae bacterium]|nr:MAG: hypothetical protein CM15mP65_20060 [Crocinitomicaceae bacterium]